MKEYFWQFIGYLLSLALRLEAIVYNMVADALKFVINIPANFVTFDAVEVGWVVVRDIVNMFFILILLVIAFATILGIESYQYKKILPRLIIAILLVNFSRTICSFFVEASNVLMTSLTLGQSNNNVAGTLTRGLSLDQLGTISDTVAAKSITDSSMAAGMVMYVLFVGLFIVALTSILVLLIVRIVALMFLIILSPLAFVFDVIPRTQEYAKKWWGEFIKFVIYGPAATFCVYLTMTVASSLKDKGFSSMYNPSVIGKNGTEFSALKKGGSLFTSDWSLDHFMRYALVMAILFSSVLLVKQVGSFGSAALLGLAMSGLKKGVGLTTLPFRAFGKERLLGQGARALVRRSLMQGGEGVIGKYGLGLIPGLYGGFRGLATGKGFRAGYNELAKPTGQYARFLSPTLIKDAWNARQVKLEGLAARGSRGFVQDRMNRVLNKAFPGLKDEKDYEGLDKTRAVEQEKHELQEANPGLEHYSLRQALSKAIDKGDKIRERAAFELLFINNNANEVFRDLAKDDNLAKKMFDEDFLNSDYYKQFKDDPESITTFGIEARRQMLVHRFGEEEALDIVREMAEAHKGKNNHDWTEMAAFNQQTGEAGWAGDEEIEAVNDSLLAEGKEKLTYTEEVALREHVRGHGSSIEMSKQGARGIAQVARFSRFKLGYNKEGKEKVLGLNEQEMSRVVRGLVQLKDIGELLRFANSNAQAMAATPDGQQAYEDGAILSVMANFDPDIDSGLKGGSWAISNLCVARKADTTKEGLQGRLKLHQELSTRISKIATEDDFRKEMTKWDPRFKMDKYWNVYMATQKKAGINTYDELQVNALKTLDKIFGVALKTSTTAADYESAAKKGESTIEMGKK